MGEEGEGGAAVDRSVGKQRRRGRRRRRRGEGEQRERESEQQSMNGGGLTERNTDVHTRSVFTHKQLHVVNTGAGGR